MAAYMPGLPGASNLYAMQLAEAQMLQAAQAAQISSAQKLYAAQVASIEEQQKQVGTNSFWNFWKCLQSNSWPEFDSQVIIFFFLFFFSSI